MKSLILATTAAVGAVLASADLRTSTGSSDASAVRINEVLADNRSVVTDEHGDFDDYLELYNAGDEPVDVGGMYLSDGEHEPKRWRIPDGTVVPAGGVLLVWADGEEHQGPLHASFKLSAEGEMVGLYDRDERRNRFLDRVAFGPQEPDVAFGSAHDGSRRRRALTPSPGLRNDR